MPDKKKPQTADEFLDELANAITPASLSDVKRVEVRLKYGEALHTELLTFMFKKGLITKDEAHGIVKRAHERSKR